MRPGPKAGSNMAEAIPAQGDALASMRPGPKAGSNRYMRSMRSE